MAATRVLASGLALGHYLPGLAITRNLRLASQPVEVEVYEEQLTEAQHEAIDATRRAYHADRRLAQVGQRLSGALASTADPSALDVVIDRWEAARVGRLIVLSGYWRDAVASYLARRGAGQVVVEWLHVDTTVSPSWRAFAELDGARHVWLGRADQGLVERRIRMSSRPVVPFAERARRLVAHGGGWGLGGYREAARALLGGGYEIDLVSYGADDAAGDDRVRVFRDDPAWRPWQRGPDGRFGVPTCARVGGGPLDTTDGPGVLELVRAAYAIVSKPGGATLWDGLSTATPIIFAPTDAAHERGNADLWCRLGWGVRLEDWQAAGHPAVQLEEIHRNLLQALATVPVYPVAELGPLR